MLKWTASDHGTMGLMTKKASLALCVVGMFVLASGCASGGSTSSGNKTLTVDTAFTGHMVLDPGGPGETTAALLMYQLYEPLVKTDEKQTSKLDPVLAQSYAASADGRSVTFNLRQNVRFSDGTPMTSDDVVWTFTRDQNINGLATTFLQGMTITAVDKYTVRVDSPTPKAALANTFSFIELGIINSKVAKANGGTDAVGADKTDTAASFLNVHSAGTGPYMLDSIDPASQATLKVNPNYWGPKPAYSRIIVKNTPVSSQVLEVQRSSNIVALDIAPQQAAGLNSSTVKVFTVPAVEQFILNLSPDPSNSRVTANKDFRTAVRYGIDYKAVLSIAGLGAVQSPGLVPPGWLGALPADQATQRDVTKAKAALASSGLTNPTITFDYSTADAPSGISFATLAQKIQSNLAEIGITVNLVPDDTTTFFTKWRTNHAQALLTTAGPSAVDSGIFLLWAPGNLLAQWSGFQKGVDPNLDAVSAQVANTIDPSQRQQLFVTYQTLQNNDAVFVPLFHAALAMVASKSVGGLNWTGTYQNINFAEMT